MAVDGRAASQRGLGSRRLPPGLARAGTLSAPAPRANLPRVTTATASILQSALELEIDQRAELAAELLASLDGAPDEDAEAAWAVEIERRATRARSGEDLGRSWSEVRDRIKRALASR